MAFAVMEEVALPILLEPAYWTVKGLAAIELQEVELAVDMAGLLTKCQPRHVAIVVHRHAREELHISPCPLLLGRLQARLRWDCA